MTIRHTVKRPSHINKCTFKMLKVVYVGRVGELEGRRGGQWGTGLDGNK